MAGRVKLSVLREIFGIEIRGVVELEHLSVRLEGHIACYCILECIM